MTAVAVILVTISDFEGVLTPFWRTERWIPELVISGLELEILRLRVPGDVMGDSDVLLRCLKKM